MGFYFTEERKRAARRILESYPTKRSALLPMLWLVYEQERCISPEAMSYVARELGMTESEVGSAASFYDIFREGPEPLHHIRVCGGICCRMKGADRIAERLKARTVDDERFKVSEVDCLGLCDRAPALAVGDEEYGELTEERVDRILSDLGLKY